MQSLERAPTINPDLAAQSHGRVERRVVYVGGAYCPQNQPRAAEPSEPSKPLEWPTADTASDDAAMAPRNTPLDRIVATWPAPARIALVVAVLVLGAVAMVTAGAGVGAILTGASLLH